jgi:hypothetical protein
MFQQKAPPLQTGAGAFSYLGSSLLYCFNLMPDENKPAPRGSLLNFGLSDIFGAGKGLEKLLDTVKAGIGRLADGASEVANVQWLDKKRADNEAYHTQVVGDAQTHVIQERVRAIATLVSEGLHPQSISFDETRVSGQLIGLPQEARDLHERAQRRIAIENIMQQLNREASVAYAAAELVGEENISDAPVDPDWLTRYWRTVQDISQEDAQLIFGKILAGEVKQPGTFSIRTIDLLAALTKKEGEDFRWLCAFSWQYKEAPTIILFDFHNKGTDITTPSYSMLRHLEDIGLIAINPASLGGYIETVETMLLHYGDKSIEVRSSGVSAGPDNSPTIDIGVVLFTSVGVELARVCQPTLDDTIMEYAIENWIRLGHKVTRSPSGRT